MSLKKMMFKNFLIFSFLVALIYSLYSMFIFNDLIKKSIDFYVKDKISFIKNIIDSKKEFLKKTAIDWGEWDDTYNFIKNRNKKYIVSNFGGGNTLKDLGIDGIVFLDKNLRLIYGRIVKNNKEIVIKKLPPFDYSKNGFKFYLLKDRLYLVYITDITDTKKEKKIGKIAVFKILNKKLFEKANLILLSITCKNFHKLYEIERNKILLYYPLNNKIFLVFKINLNKALFVVNEFVIHHIVILLITFIILIIIGNYLIIKITKDLDFVFKTLFEGINDFKKLEKFKNYKFYLKDFEKISNVFEKLYEKLFNYEEIYNILDKDVPFGVIIYRNKILYANKFFLNLFDLSKDDLKNLSALDFIKDESLKEELLQINEKVLKKEKIYLRYMTSLKYKDKEIFSYIVSFPIIYENKQSVMMFMLDLTKEIKYQEILERILRFIPIVIFECKNNELITISENIKEILGYDIDDLSGNWCIEYIHPKDKDNIKKLKQKEKLDAVVRIRKKDDSYIWAREFLFYKKGEIYGLLEDITVSENVKRLNAALSEINQFLIASNNLKSILEIVCNKFIESGVFKFAWIGKLKENKIVPIKYFGEDKKNLLSEINDNALFCSVKEILFKNDIIEVNQNTFLNKKLINCKEQLLKNGFFSSVTIKLIDGLSLNLYSEFTDFYTPEVINVILSIRSSIMMGFEKNDYIKQLQYLTYFDKITGLGNLNKFKKDLEKYDKKFVLCMINIVDFTSIIANFGFEFGNKILKSIANELNKVIEGEKEIYKICNDRFLLFLKNENSNLESVKKITSKIYNLFSVDGIEIDNQKIYLEINGGIVSSDNIEKEKVLEALTYVYVFAKKNMNKFVVYEPWMYEELKERVYLKELLFKAIKEKLFEVYFQPVVDINTYKVEQFEALLRLRDNGKFVNMEKFINIANELQLVPEITKIVVEKVINYVKIFKTVKEDISVSINISKFDIEEEFLEFFKQNVIDNNLDFKYFSLEITERETIVNTELTKNFVNELKKVGVKFEIDDFGVAYSNLNQTVSLDFDVLKIDKSFVDKIFEEKIQTAIKSIIFLAKSFNAKTIAEGVETKAQLEILKQLGVDYIQGYYFAKPMPFDEAIEYLKKNI